MSSGVRYADSEIDWESELSSSLAAQGGTASTYKFYGPVTSITVSTDDDGNGYYSKIGVKVGSVTRTGRYNSRYYIGVKGAEFGEIEVGDYVLLSCLKSGSYYYTCVIYVLDGGSTDSFTTTITAE